MHSLDERLAAAGIAPGTEPMTAWRQLRATEGSRTTIPDLYELGARASDRTARDLDAAERLALARRAMPEIWPGYEVVAAAERGVEPIELVDYEPEWNTRYERWRKRIAGVVDAVRIDHVGSTSVPGLPAKPIVDIQVSVHRLDDENGYVPPLERLDLRLRSRDTFHRYFRPVRGRSRDVHVHVCAAGSQWERDHLLFRDYLRRHADARASYAAAKYDAAARWGDDRIAYTEAKTEVILAILERAAAEEYGTPPPQAPGRVSARDERSSGRLQP